MCQRRKCAIKGWYPNETSTFWKKKSQKTISNQEIGNDDAKKQQTLWKIRWNMLKL